MDRVLGWTATLIFNSMFVPQIIKTIRTGSAKDVSIGLFWLSFTGNIIAWCYAFIIWQPPILFKYTVDWLLVTTYIVVYYNIRRRK